MTKFSKEFLEFQRQRMIKMNKTTNRERNKGRKIVPRIELVCQECKKHYFVIPARQWTNKLYGKEQRKFCSIVCQRLGQKKFWNTPEERIKRSERQKGNKNSRWVGGYCNWRDQLRSTQAYKRFVKFIFSRDKYTCKDCGKVGGVLHTHHLKQVALHPELVMTPSNVITLCISCHKKTDSYLKIRKGMGIPLGGQTHRKFLEKVKTNRFQEFGHTSVEVRVE